VLRLFVYLFFLYIFSWLYEFGCRLHGKTLLQHDPSSYTECYKYLGHMIKSVLSDDRDIMKQTRSLYTRANVIICKFSHASLNTKLMLFRAYCTPIYGCQLWSTMFQYSYSKLRVAYSDAFRQLQHEPRWCCASQLFVFHNASLFTEIIRKLAFLFSL